MRNEHGLEIESFYIFYSITVNHKMPLKQLLLGMFDWIFMFEGARGVREKYIKSWLSCVNMNVK